MWASSAALAKSMRSCFGGAKRTVPTPRSCRVSVALCSTQVFKSLSNLTTVLNFGLIHRDARIDRQFEWYEFSQCEPKGVKQMCPNAIFWVIHYRSKPSLTTHIRTAQSTPPDATLTELSSSVPTVSNAWIASFLCHTTSSVFTFIF